MPAESLSQTPSGSKCELCGATEKLAVYAVPPVSERDTDRCVLACATCLEQIEGRVNGQQMVILTRVTKKSN